MADREEMKRALVAAVIPALREHGFSGRFPHFRRISQAKTDLLTVQFDRHGGGFVIEIAVAPPGEFTTHWGSAIPQGKLTAHDLHPQDRARVQPGGDGSTESWFRYDGGQPPDRVAAQLLSYLGQMEHWWSGQKRQLNVRNAES